MKQFGLGILISIDYRIISWAVLGIKEKNLFRGSKAPTVKGE